MGPQATRLLCPWDSQGKNIGVSCHVLFHISVQFSRSVMSDSLWPHGLQHARPPCPSPTPGAYSNSCPLSWWCHPTISASVAPFSSYLQSFPASGSFLMSQPFASGGQVLDFQLQHHFLQRNPRADPTPYLKSINSSVLSLLHSPTLTSIHDHRKDHSLD